MQGQVLRDSALLPPGENLAQVICLGQLAVQVFGALRGAPENQPYDSTPSCSDAWAASHVSDQVIEWASRLLRVAVVAPSIVAITTPEPPEVAESDSVAACVESVTFR
jgi:hypothetical protein